VEKKLVRFLNSRRGIASDQQINISDAIAGTTFAPEERDGS
jgi:hypothetical protein